MYSLIDLIATPSCPKIEAYCQAKSHLERCKEVCEMRYGEALEAEDQLAAFLNQNGIGDQGTIDPKLQPQLWKQANRLVVRMECQSGWYEDSVNKLEKASRDYHARKREAGIK